MRKKIKLSQLTLLEDNPRTISKKELAKLQKDLESDVDFLKVHPVFVNQTKKGLIVYAGNQRVRAARELGWEEIDCDVQEISTKLMRERALKHNVGRGTWDIDILTESWKDEIKTVDVTELLKKIGDTVTEDEYDEEPPKNPKSKTGEIYQLGNHRLMCGDSTSQDAVAALLDGKKADMVFTDPPYNVAYEGGTDKSRDMIMNDKMTNTAFYQFLASACKRMVDNSNGAIYVCMSSTEMANLQRAFREAGGHFSSFIIWVKNRFTLTRSDYQQQYEPILYGWNAKIKNHFYLGNRDKSNVVYDVEKHYDDKTDQTVIEVGGNRIILEGKPKGVIEKNKIKRDIWEFPRPTKSAEHPTMKPVRLVAEAIRNSSEIGNTVLDLFGGSGSTLIACEQLQRRCAMMELDPRYVDVIIHRWEEITGQTAKLLTKA